MSNRSSRRCFRSVRFPRFGDPEPDWTKVHEDLQTHKDLTLQLVWQEGRESNPEGYGYSRFCELYRRWLKKLDLVLRQEHRAGEKMFVDYAGATIPVHNPESGEVHGAAVFVAVLGASSYTFAETTTGQNLQNWIKPRPPRCQAVELSRAHENFYDRGYRRRWRRKRGRPAGQARPG